jgi:hypothetical protein
MAMSSRPNAPRTADDDAHTYKAGTFMRPWSRTTARGLANAAQLPGLGR